MKFVSSSYCRAEIKVGNLQSQRCPPERWRYMKRNQIIIMINVYTDNLAGNPRWRSLIFPAIGDLAFYAAGNELENNLFAAVQSRPFVILGGRKDQPVSPQNLVRAALGENLIAPVRIHFQGRSLATVRLPGDFKAHAIIGSREVGLRADRHAAEEQAQSANNENFSYAIEQSVMISHSGLRVLNWRDPEGLRRAIGSAFSKKQCKRCAIKVTN